MKYCTMTGADDSVEPRDVLDLGMKYPLVEWGILVSRDRFGTGRFPSKEWIDKFLQQYGILGCKNSLSVHLCGRWVRDLMMAEPTAITEYGQVLMQFDRMQINFHGRHHKVNLRFYERFKEFDTIKKKQYIFQFDKVNEGYMAVARKHDFDCVPLFDTSGGAGVLPDQWPNPLHAPVMCGYAGGLGPQNLAVECGRIQEIVKDRPIWIDMETHVRSNYDKQFDLKKVEECLKIAEAFKDDEE